MWNNDLQQFFEVVSGPKHTGNKSPDFHTSALSKLEIGVAELAKVGSSGIRAGGGHRPGKYGFLFSVDARPNRRKTLDVAGPKRTEKRNPYWSPCSHLRLFRMSHNQVERNRVGMSTTIGARWRELNGDNARRSVGRGGVVPLRE